jgi:hypothetical protein
MARKTLKLAAALLLAFILSASISGLLVPFLRQMAYNRVDSLLASLQHSVHSVTGLNLDYSHAVLHSSERITIHGVELYRETRDGLAVARRRVLSLSSLDVRFNLFAAVFGDPSGVLEHVDARDLNADFVLPADLAIIDTISAYLDGRPKSPLPRLSMDLGNVSLSAISAEGEKLSASVASLHFSSMEELLELEIPSLVLFASHPRLGSEELFLQAMGMSVSSPADVSSIKAVMGISGKMGTLVLSEQSLELMYGKGEVRGSVRGKGYFGEVEYGLGSGGVRAVFEMEGFRPSGVVEGLEGLYGELGGLEYAGRVKLGYAGEGVGYEGEVRVQGKAGQRVAGMDVGGVEAGVKGRGDGSGMEEARVWVKGRGYEGEYRGALGYGELGLLGELVVEGREGKVVARVEGKRGEYEAEVKEGSVGGVDVSGMKARVREAQDRYDVSVAGLLGGGGVRGEASLLKGGKGYEASLGLEKVDVGGLAGVVKAYGVEVPDIGVEEARVSGDVVVRGGQGKLSWVASGVKGEVRVKGEEYRFRGAGVGDEGRYELKGVEVEGRGQVVGVSGKGEYGRKGELGFEGVVGYGGMGYGVKLRYGSGKVEFEGDYGLAGEVRKEEKGYAGKLVVKGLPVKVGAGVAYVDVRGEGSWEEGGAWAGVAQEVGLRYEGEGKVPELRIGVLELRPGVLVAKGVEVKGEGYGLLGSLQGSYVLSGKEPAFALTGQMKGEGVLGGGRATYELSLGYGEGRGRVGVKAVGYDLGYAGGTKLAGMRAGVELEAEGVLTLGKLLEGDLSELESWVAKGTGSLEGQGWKVAGQSLELMYGKGEVRGSVRGKGYFGEVEYGLGSGGVRAVFEMEGFRPSGVVEGLEGLYGELGGLEYAGRVKLGYAGEGVGYEGEVRVQGKAGQRVAGMDVGGVEAGVKGRGDGSGMEEARVWVKGRGYEGEYRGALGYGELGLLGELVVEGREGKVVARVEGKRGEYEAEVKEGSVGGVDVSGMKARVREAQDRYDVSVAGLLGGGGVRGEASLLKGGKGYEASLGLEKVDVGGLAGVVKAYGVEVPDIGVEEARVSGDVVVRGGQGKLSWVASGVKGEVRVKGEEYRFRGAGVGDEGRYELKGVEVEGRGQVVGVSGKGEYGRKGELGFEGVVGYGGMGYGVKLRYGSGKVEFEGDYGLAGEVRKEEKGYAGKLVVKGLPVKVGAGVAYVDVRGEGSWEEGGAWAGVAQEVGLRYEGEGKVPELRIGVLELRPGVLVAKGVEVKGEGYGLLGSLQGSYVLSGKEPAFALTGQFQSQESSLETYNFDLSYRESMLKSTVFLRGIPIERYVSGGLRGAVEAVLRMEGPFDLNALKPETFDFASMDWKGIPSIAFEARLVSGEYRSIPLRLSLSGTFSEGELTFVSPEIDYVNHRISGMTANYLLADKVLKLRFDYRTVLGTERLETEVEADARLTFSPGTESDAFSIAFDFSGLLRNVKYRETLAEVWEFSGGYKEGSLSIDAGKGSLTAKIGMDGGFEIGLGESMPLLARLAGQLTDGQIEASLDVVDADLKRLLPLFPLGKLEVLAGTLSGNLGIKGPVADPELEGALIIQEGKVRSTELLQGDIGPFGALITFSGKNVEMKPSLVQLENGALTMSASALLDRWSLEDLTFDVTSKDGSVLTISTKIAGITLLDAKATLEMDLSLDNGVLVAAGTSYLERGRVLVNPAGFLPENQPPEDPDAMAFRVDLDIKFGKQLEFYLPDISIPVVRGFTAPTSLLKFKFDSQTRDFSLDGKVDLRSGYLFYYLRNFFIKSSTIEFSESEAKFNPLITVAAELRESNLEGTVKILLDARKAPLDNLNPKLSSIPFYTETQLISMMSGGILASQSEGKDTVDIREAAIASSEFIPQFNIFNNFERNVQKALGLDIVFIRSSFLQRWLLDLTDPSAGGSKAEEPVAKYLDQSELYFGKYITDAAFFHASLRFRDDPLVSASRLRLDSEFGIEFESPLGLINWSITPSLEEGSLVTGQELSLSWQYMF